MELPLLIPPTLPSLQAYGVQALGDILAYILRIAAAVSAVPTPKPRHLARLLIRFVARLSQGLARLLIHLIITSYPVPAVQSAQLPDWRQAKLTRKRTPARTLPLICS